MQESNQTAPSSLACAPTKHSTCLQPTLVTKPEKRFLPQAPRVQSSSLSLCKAQSAKGRDVLPSCLPTRPLQSQGSQRLLQGEGTHVTGAGCSKQHLQGAFYTNLFLYRVVKKNKIEAPIGCSYRSLGFYRLWVGD